MSRLEEIKERYIEYEYDFNLDNEHIDWLINRVEELEEELLLVNTTWTHYKNQSERYKQALEEIIKEETVTTALSDGQVAYTISGHIARKALEESE